MHSFGDRANASNKPRHRSQHCTDRRAVSSRARIRSRAVSQMATCEKQSGRAACDCRKLTGNQASNLHSTNCTSHTDWAIFSLANQTKKKPTPLHWRWVPSTRVPTLLVDNSDQKNQPTARRTLRLKSLSLAQPPHGPTFSRAQPRSRSAPRRVRPCKRERV